jgi:thermostable 8-oxoguanine DNA glycosylase
VDTVKYLDRIGVLWQGEQSQIEKALRDYSCGTRHFGPQKASDFIYQNRQSLYDSGAIVALVKLLEVLSKQDTILARNVLAGHNKEMEIHCIGTDIRLKNLYIKGLGMKWASHLLRELGFSHNELAILDSHIVECLVQFGVIARAPKTLAAETYLNIEGKMKKWERKEIPDIPLDHLDWVMWDMARAAACR